MKYLLYSLIFILPLCASAQETVVQKNRITNRVTEQVTVLKSDKVTREGPYQAFLDKKHPLAVGRYQNNAKVGVWSFYTPDNSLLQRYNYTTKELIYEGREDTTSFCRYLVDYPLKEGDKVTKPIRIGDRYYGYVNYLKLFKLPNDVQNTGYGPVLAVVELLVSPGGRLADYAVHLQAMGFDQKYHINLDLLSEEDKTFIPATLNDNPVTCQIIIRCVLQNNGKIDIEW